MTYKKAIKFILDNTELESEKAIILFVKNTFYDLEIKITEKTVEAGVIALADSVRDRLIYVN